MPTLDCNQAQLINCVGAKLVRGTILKRCMQSFAMLTKSRALHGA